MLNSHGAVTLAAAHRGLSKDGAADQLYMRRVPAARAQRARARVRACRDASWAAAPSRGGDLRRRRCSRVHLVRETHELWTSKRALLTTTADGGIRREARHQLCCTSAALTVRRRDDLLVILPPWAGADATWSSPLLLA